jgi:hypothetical protein
MQFGENPIMHVARDERRDLVEILFPHSKPIAYVPSWSVDGLISTMKHRHSMLKVYISADLYFHRVAVTCISGA